MKTDFEKLLQQQPVKKIPGHWRAQILQAANAASVSQPTTLNSQPSWFHQLLWPCPQAWGAVAAVWVVIFLLNLNSSGQAPVMAAVTPTPTPEIMAALKQQRIFKAELIGLSEPMEVQKGYIAQPRSELIRPTVAV